MHVPFRATSAFQGCRPSSWRGKPKEGRLFTGVIAIFFLFRFLLSFFPFAFSTGVGTSK